MNISLLINKLKESKEINNPIKKHTLLVNEKSETQGALFFIPMAGKEYKLMVPAPFHEDVLKETQLPSYLSILSHPEVFLLK